MGFANYFNKDVLALNKLISSQSEEEFKSILNRHIIGIEIDDQLNTSKAVKDCFEMLVRVLSRFYPKIKIIKADDKVNSDSISRFKRLGKEINSNLEFAKHHEQPTFIISLSRKECISPCVPHLYIGSDGWKAKLSSESPLEFKASSNIFGVSFAACIGASNVFKYVFMDYLKLELDTEVSFSVLDFTGMENVDISIDKVVLEDVTLVGVGAIGSATIWALSKIKGLEGTLTLVDNEEVDESNLQRYILLKEKDVRKNKVDLAHKFLGRRNNLKVLPIVSKWDEYISRKHDGQCNSRLVAVAVDTIEHRINIQSSLPKKIINAYTDESRFGISRHPNFIFSPCLACLYMPTGLRKSKLILMTEELNMVGEEEFVYKYMKPDRLIDDNFLTVFCQKNNYSVEELEPYKNKSLGEFYIELVCGFGMIELQKEENVSNKVDVPLSFQSSLAGIMLAAEIVIESIGEKKSSEYDVSQLEVLNKIDEFNPYHYSRIKNDTKNCICSDEDYKYVYKLKWGD